MTLNGGILMRSPIYTKTDFHRVYFPLLAKGTSKTDIAKKMGISYRTLLRYCHKFYDSDKNDGFIDISEDLQSSRPQVESPSEEVNLIVIENANEMANKIVDTSYKTNISYMKKCIKIYETTKDVSDLEKANRAVKESMLILKTISEITKTKFNFNLNLTNNIEITQVNVMFMQVFDLVLPVLKKYNVPEGEIKQLAQGVDNIVTSVIDTKEAGK